MDFPKVTTPMGLLRLAHDHFGDARLITSLRGMQGIKTVNLEVKGDRDSTWRPIGEVHQTDTHTTFSPHPKADPSDLKRVRALLS